MRFTTFSSSGPFTIIYHKLSVRRHSLGSQLTINTFGLIKCLHSSLLRLNPFAPDIKFLYPLIKPEKQGFSDGLRGKEM